jgi:lipid A 3-O-deacylase
MNKLLTSIFIILSLSFCTLFAKDGYGISVNGGRGSTVDIARLGIQKDFESVIYSNETFNLKGFHELGLNYWNGNRKNISAVSYSPVFVVDFNQYTTQGYKPYVDFGIGIAFLSDTLIDSKNMSSSFQFEDRISLGITKDNIDMYIRYMHYSNGGIKKPNDGINMGLIGFNYRF